jgi:hypothetical protein
LLAPELNSVVEWGVAEQILPVDQSGEGGATPPTPHQLLQAPAVVYSHTLVSISNTDFVSIIIHFSTQIFLWNQPKIKVFFVRNGAT